MKLTPPQRKSSECSECHETPSEGAIIKQLLFSSKVGIHICTSCLGKLSDLLSPYEDPTFSRCPKCGRKSCEETMDGLKCTNHLCGYLSNLEET